MKNLQAYGGWAVITGASAGIGREFARAIAARGVNCALVARRAERLDALAEELRASHGIECRCIAQDLARDGAVDEIVQAMSDVPVGILVNNAGFGQAGHFDKTDPGRLISMVTVNCLAPVLLTRALLPPMAERGRGAVIMVSSILGVIPSPYETVYGATKAFDLFFGEGLWAEMRGTGVDVITLCPSTTKTEFFIVGGVSEENLGRIHARADLPEDIVALTLRKLGRKPMTGPWSFSIPTFFVRFFPRKLVLQITGRVMRKELLNE